MSITFKKKERYLELEIFNNYNKKVGEAEIEINGKMLSRLHIYEPYQNIGYGTEVVKSLIKDYGINCLWVEADNEHAIHVYEKCGFKKKNATMYLMERE